MASIGPIVTVDDVKAITGKRHGDIRRSGWIAPDPFVIPTSISDSPKDLLLYSGRIIIEIMTRLNLEIGFRRGSTGIEWRKYWAVDGSTIDFELFTPDLNKNQLANAPVKFFPQYVKDIQTVISALLEDPLIPDTLDAFFARIFANNTSVNNDRIWDDDNKINDNFVAINPDSDGDLRPLTIKALSNAQSAKWLFPDSYIKNCVPYLGVKPDGILRANEGIRGLDSGDVNFPQSVIGIQTPSGIGGIDIPMHPNNRPFSIITDANPGLTIERMPRKHTSNTRQGTGAGSADFEQGYSYLAHFAEVIQMLRYQAVNLEWFPDNISSRFYVSPITSNTTFNLPFILAQPIIKSVNQNWGNWLFQGTVGVINNRLDIRVVDNGAFKKTGQCPANLFFPDPTEICSCFIGAGAYALWFAKGQGFIWENVSWSQFGRGQPISIGPNTKLEISYSTNASVKDATTAVSESETKANGEDFSASAIGFQVGIRTDKLGLASFQPFRYILGPDQTSVNIQEALAADPDVIIPATGERYKVGGLDQVLAIQILVTYVAKTIQETSVADGPGGSFIPPGSAPTCPFTESFATIDYIKIDEVDFTKDPVTGYL